jgi:hypothetical protein
MMKSGPGQSAESGKIYASAMIQGAVVEHNEKQYYQQPLFGLVYLQRSATLALEELLEKNKELEFNAEGMPVLTFFNKQYAHRLNQPTMSASNINLAAGGYAPATSSRGGDEWKGLAVVTERGPALERNAAGQIDIAAKGRCCQPWNKVLRYLTAEQQVELLKQAFQDKRELLIYALGNTGYLPESFIRGTVHVDMGATKTQEKHVPLHADAPPAGGPPASASGMSWGAKTAAPRTAPTNAPVSDSDWIPGTPGDPSFKPAGAGVGPSVVSSVTGPDPQADKVKNLLSRLAAGAQGQS